MKEEVQDAFEFAHGGEMLPNCFAQCIAALGGLFKYKMRAEFDKWSDTRVYDKAVVKLAWCHTVSANMLRVYGCTVFGAVRAFADLSQSGGPETCTILSGILADVGRMWDMGYGIRHGIRSGGLRKYTQEIAAMDDAQVDAIVQRMRRIPELISDSQRDEFWKETMLDYDGALL